MTVLAVFRSRSQTLDFVSRLSRNGVNVQTINTPKEANVGCGLSAKFSSSNLVQAKFILKNVRYSAFVGFYAYENLYGVSIFRQI